MEVFSNDKYKNSDFDFKNKTFSLLNEASQSDCDSDFFNRKKKKKRVLMDSDESSNDSSDSDESDISVNTANSFDELIKALNCTLKTTNKLVGLFKFTPEDLLKFSLSNAKLPGDAVFSASPKYHLLKDYQKCSVSWLLVLNKLGLGCILADEMGLGKTAQIAIFLSLLYSNTMSKYVSESDLLSFYPFGTGKKSSTIIAVPASILDHWMSELNYWAPNISDICFKYHGTQQARRELACKKLGKDGVLIIVTTTSMIASREDLKILHNVGDIECLVVDEAHSLKNSDSNVYKSLDRAFNIRQRILLTGTPVQNRITEFSSLLNFVLPFNVDLAFYSLNDKTQQSLMKYSKKGVKSDKDLARLAQFVDKIRGFESKDPGSSFFQRAILYLISPFVVRRLKSHVSADLPPKESYIIRVPLSGLQKDLYDKEINERNPLLVGSNTPSEDSQERFEGSADGERSSEEELDDKGRKLKFIKSILFRLRRIINHPYLTVCSYYSKEQIDRIIDYFYKHVEGFRNQTREKVALEISSWCDYEIHQSVRDLGKASISDLRIPSKQLVQGAKIHKLIDLLSSISHHKVLIFSHFTSFLDIIYEILSYVFPDLPIFRLDGQVKLSDRSEILGGFTSTKLRSVMLISTKTGGTGLNLTAATCVIIMDHDWNPHNDIQAEDRIHRFGQTKPVCIYRICCKDTIEEKILATWVEKLKLNNAFGGDSNLLLQAIQSDNYLENDIQQV